MAYFVITPSEDGTDIDLLDEKELLERLSPDEDGEYYYGQKPDFVTPEEAEERIKMFAYDDTGTILIIKGEVVVPKPAKVVETYTLE